MTAPIHPDRPPHAVRSIIDPAHEPKPPGTAAGEQEAGLSASNVVYLVAQAGEDQAMAYLGNCGREGVLSAMQSWDESHCWSDPHGPYEWTTDDCLDVYEVDGPISETDAVNELLVDIGARRIGLIEPTSNNAQFAEADEVAA